MLGTAGAVTGALTTGAFGPGPRTESEPGVPGETATDWPAWTSTDWPRCGSVTPTTPRDTPSVAPLRPTWTLKRVPLTTAARNGVWILRLRPARFSKSTTISPNCWAISNFLPALSLAKIAVIVPGWTVTMSSSWARSTRPRGPVLIQAPVGISIPSTTRCQVLLSVV